MKQEKIEYILFEEFVRNSGVKERTVIARYRKGDIPGITKNGETYQVISGTRYPCDLHRCKLENSKDRRYWLLKSISQYKYITHKDLRVEYQQFVDLLKDLLVAGFIRENHLCNKYGANAYDTTSLGDRILDEEEKKAKEELVKLIAEAAGTFSGAVIAQIVD